MRHILTRTAFAISMASLCSLAACGGDTSETGAAGGGNTTHPSAPPLPGETECTVIAVTDIAVESAAHVETCADVEYATNPPSGGEHWPVWAAFNKYDKAVPREMYVHDLEHGAIALLYRCDGECPDVVAALKSVFDEAKDTCDKPRVLLSPDPDLDTPIAAAAWGATYTATCIDTKSLAEFVTAHIGKGPEDVCTDGADVSSGSACL